MPTEEEKQQYALRIDIENKMYQLLDVGFTIDDLRDFVEGVVDDIEAEEEDE